jgi:hypothetical protein
MPDTIQAADRHEIECRCGHTAVGDGRFHAEANHLRHFLNDHDDLEEWEVELAEEQLEYAEANREQ